MGPLAGFERFLERLFERPSARLFGARLQPIQLQRRLERAMESERLTASGRTVVPNNFEVRLSPVDWAQFEDVAETLAGELADACLAYARQRHYTLRDRPRVMLLADDSLTAGDVAVATAYGRAFGTNAGAPAIEPGTGSHGHAPTSAGDLGQVRTAPPVSAEGSSRTGEGGGTGVAAEAAGAAAVSAVPERVVEAVAHEPVGAMPPPGVPEHTMVFEVPRQRAPRARLKLVTPDGGERDVEVSGAPVTVGRGTDNDLVVRDGRVSRHHVRLQPRGGTLVLTDLGSTNGTRVNGVTVQEVALGDGDRIELGDSVLIVEATRDR